MKNYPLALLLLLPLAGCTPGESAQLPSSPAEWNQYADPETGHQVWQITSGDAPSQAAYFEAQAFTSDDQYYVFTSRRSGSWQLYRADLQSGEIVQLTEVDDLGQQSFTVHPDGRHVYFIDGDRMARADVYTAEVTTVKELRGELTASPSKAPILFTSDGNYTVVSSRDEDGTLVKILNVHTGETREALRWEGAMSHPMINPADENLISFVPGPDTQNDMTLPMEERARTWIVDVRTGDARQFLTMPYGFRATHETWSPDGERFFFYQKTQPGWVPVSIMSQKIDGSDWQVHFADDEDRLGHGAPSRDGLWYVSDSQTPGRNPLYLISLETGNAEILTWTDSSISGGHAAQAHVHPSFSASGNYVTYTSDRTGTPQAYVVPITQEMRLRLSGQTASR